MGQLAGTGLQGWLESSSSVVLTSELVVECAHTVVPDGESEPCKSGGRGTRAG